MRTPHLYAIEPTGGFEDDPNVADNSFPLQPTGFFRTVEQRHVRAERTHEAPQQPRTILTAVSQIFCVVSTTYVQYPNPCASQSQGAVRLRSHRSCPSPARSRSAPESSKWGLSPKLVLGENTRGPRRCFTIVELQIVATAMAVLAIAMTYSCNGISGCTKASVSASMTDQVAKTIPSYAITSAGQYPTTLADTAYLTATHPFCPASPTMQSRDRAAPPRPRWTSAVSRRALSRLWP